MRTRTMLVPALLLASSLGWAVPAAAQAQGDQQAVPPTAPASPHQEQTLRPTGQADPQATHATEPGREVEEGQKVEGMPATEHQKNVLRPVPDAPDAPKPAN